MTWAIVKPRDAWVRQAKRLGRSRAQAPQDAPLRDLATFALLIEALAALTPGQVSQVLQDLAGLRPVGAVLGMPDRGDTRLDAGDAGDWSEGYPMQAIDITPTPDACRQIARLFRAQQIQSEALSERASRARDALDGLDDSEIGPWDRALLAAAFEALGEGEDARVARLRDGLDALGPYATVEEDHEEGADDAAHA